MLAIIPLSEKKDLKKRRITVTAEVLIHPRDFEILKLLAGNEPITLQDMFDKVFDGKPTYKNKQKIWESINRLRAVGFNIETRVRIGYRLLDEVYIK